jgi:hypothetical protein
MSPRMPSDPTGPLLADQVCCWYTYGNDLTSNHRGPSGRAGVEGYNQLFSDGHVTWISALELPPGVPGPDWIFYPGGGWPYYYWIEKP